MEVVGYFIFYCALFVAGFVLVVDGFGEAVNFMGDRKTSIFEKLFGVAMMVVGAILMGVPFR